MAALPWKDGQAPLPVRTAQNVPTAASRCVRACIAFMKSKLTTMVAGPFPLRGSFLVTEMASFVDSCTATSGRCIFSVKS